MAKGILTNREVKNKVTGVDIYVSDYQEVPHRLRNEYLYHVIVVSNLFYYKTREHRESDVVQFMVSKTFAEFHDLYKRLFKRFPSVNFPPLPEKSFFSRNPDGHRECMDNVLKLVASKSKLASSPMVISFLRGDPLPKELPDSEEESSEPLQQPPAAPAESSEKDTEKNTEKNIENNEPKKNEREFQDVDLFDGKPDDKPEEVVEEVISVENVEPVSSGKSIFDDDDAENDDGLFGTVDTVVDVPNKPYDLDAELDTLELSDEVDELMNLSKTSERQLSIKVNKPPPKKVNQSKRLLILDDDPDGKEDMFKKSSKTKSKNKSLWGDDNHHTLHDIFGVKKTSIFDMDDDDDDMFRSSVKKKAVKVDEMKQEDIQDYINSHDDAVVPNEQSDSLVVEVAEAKNVTVVDEHCDERSADVIVTQTEEDADLVESDIPELPESTPEQEDIFSSENTGSSIELSGANIEQNDSVLSLMDEISDEKFLEETTSSVLEAPVKSDPESDPDYVSVTEQAEAFFTEQSIISTEPLPCDRETEMAVASVVDQDVMVSTEQPSVSLTEHVETSHVQENVSISMEVPCESSPDLTDALTVDQSGLPAPIEQVCSSNEEHVDVALEDQEEHVDFALQDQKEHVDIALEDQDISFSAEQHCDSVIEQTEISHVEQEHISPSMEESNSVPEHVSSVLVEDDSLQLEEATLAPVDEHSQHLLIDDVNDNDNDNVKHDDISTSIEPTESIVVQQVDIVASIHQTSTVTEQNDHPLVDQNDIVLLAEPSDVSFVEETESTVTEEVENLSEQVSTIVMEESECSVPEPDHTSLSIEEEPVSDTEESDSSLLDQNHILLSAEQASISDVELMDNHLMAQVDIASEEPSSDPVSEKVDTSVVEQDDTSGLVDSSVTPETDSLALDQCESIEVSESCDLVLEDSSIVVQPSDTSIVDNADNSTLELDDTEISVEGTSLSFVEETHIFDSEFTEHVGPITNEVVTEETQSSALEEIDTFTDEHHDSFTQDETCSNSNTISVLSIDCSDNREHDAVEHVEFIASDSSLMPDEPSYSVVAENESSTTDENTNTELTEEKNTYSNNDSLVSSENLDL